MHFVLITHWDISIKSNYVHLSESIFREQFLRGAHISPTTPLTPHRNNNGSYGSLGFKWLSWLHWQQSRTWSVGWMQLTHAISFRRPSNVRFILLYQRFNDGDVSYASSNSFNTFVRGKRKKVEREIEMERQRRALHSSKWKWSFPEGLFIKIACK